MISSLTAHILILAVLLPVLIRPFFHPSSSISRDSAAAVPPAAAAAALLNLAANGSNILSIAVFLLSICVFLINIRSFAGLCSGLYIKYFSLPLRISSAVSLLCWMAAAAGLFFFSPAPLNSKGTAAEYYSYQGSFSRGFIQKPNAFIRSAQLTVITPDKSDKTQDKQGAVLFMTDAFLSPADYIHSMNEAAKRGFTAVCAAFNSDEGKYINGMWNSPSIRPFIMRVGRLFNSSVSPEKAQRLSRIQIMETCAALQMIQELGKTEIYIAADEQSMDEAQSVLSLFEQTVSGILPLKTFQTAECPLSKYDCADLYLTAPADFYIFMQKETNNDAE